MTNKHTALPWSTRQAEDTNWWFVLEDKDGLEIGSGDGGLEECDAQLIVTAVNYHDRLREALREARAQVVELCQTYGNPLPDASINRYDSLLAELDNLENVS